MRRKIKKIAAWTAVFSVPLIFLSCATVGIEKAGYTVLQKQRSIEVRQYEPQIIAEVLIDSDFDNAGNIAFGRLFEYISGKNRMKESIAMTAPVNQTKDSQKIAMTAPVNQQQSEDKYAVSFVMPAKYTLQTLPEPLDKSITIRQIPARKAAAIRYSGTWSQQRYEQHKSLLEKFIKDKGLVVTGDPVFARYDPPFQLWFMRRNEVVIPVE